MADHSYVYQYETYACPNCWENIATELSAWANARPLIYPFCCPHCGLAVREEPEAESSTTRPPGRSS